ncbi:DNA polymerase I [uncultured Mediterranean phage uvMED]|nr:DNA polymerase I [uncultured Mediterranean phage uvMED]BAR22544.1 DNA polymerase I (TIGR00593) [uncultured Mediterranean phage uvMED]
MQQTELNVITSDVLWRPPVILPQFEDIVAIDLETYDPYLKQTGPSYKRGAGKVTGVAIADSHQQVYLPFDHLNGDNLDKNLVVSFVKGIVRNSKEILFANAAYDLGWLESLGIRVSCPVRDVQVAEALIDEEQFSYSLNNLSKKYLNRTKFEDKLNEAAKAYGYSPKGDMWKLPARYVGEYAEIDARNTWDVYQHQIPILKEQNLWDIWELECKLTPILLQMTLKGVPVDIDRADQLNTKLLRQETKLKEKFGTLDIWSPNQLGEYITRLGLVVPKTEKGNYSVSKSFLEHCEHETVKQIYETRCINRLRKVFIEDIILKGSYKGHIHADFRQTASDQGGTRSGRLSSSNPNLQQVPKRSEIGKAIRTLYIAEPDTLWCKADYSSQEPRLQVHYALLGQFGKPLPKAEQARDAFASGEKLYTFFEKTTGLPYDTCKMLCLGISYGMGNKKMAETLGISEEVCSSTMSKFNAEAPFLKILFDSVMNKASQQGYIKTILGRRARFDFWVSDFGDKPIKNKRIAQARFKNNRVFRAFTSKGLNRLIQGSAADQAKKAMVDAHDAGFDLRLPVHDEINAMVKNKQESLDLKLIMENAIPLKVPVVADIDLGATWC